MSFGTRLLPSGPSAFTPPATETFTLTSAPDGGWTQASYPHAFYDATTGLVVFGYVDGSGNIEVRTFDPVTETTSSAFTLHATLDADTHAAPSLLLMADGHYLAAYSAHSGAQFYVRRSTNVNDASAWQTEQTLDSTLGGTMYTYPILLQLADATVWMFYRDEQDAGATAVMCYTRSTDSGLTWTAQTELYENTGNLAYWQIWSDGDTRIDFVTTDDHVVNDPCNLYHFWYQGGVYKKSDGTTITAPLIPSELTLVYNSADGPGWAYAITRDGFGNPRFVYGVIDSGSTNSYRFARWTGSAWASSTIASSAGTIESGVAAGLTLDNSDPAYVYCSVKVGSHWEIQRFRSPDQGATWEGPVSVTSGSSVDNILPGAIRDHPSSPRMVWLSGTYTSYLTTSLGVSAAR